MISLPERFLEDVKIILEDEYEQFINSYNDKKTTGLRLNTMKMTKDKFEELNLDDDRMIKFKRELYKRIRIEKNAEDLIILIISSILSSAIFNPSKI